MENSLQPSTFLRIMLRANEMKQCFFFLMLFLFSNVSIAQSLIAGWDFQTTTNGGTAAAAAPNSPTTYVANFGTGSLYLNGTNGSSTWTTATSGNQVTSFGGSNLNLGTGFSSVTTSPACLALLNTTANGKSIVFSFSMAGKANLIVTYATQATATGFTSQLWEYSTNGTTWTSSQTVGSLPTSFVVKTLTTITGLDNAATAYLRVTFNGATAAAGNNRLDNIQLNASTAAAPVVTSNSATGTVGVPFSYFISATNSPTSYSATGLPSWMSLNTTTGELSGTPNTVMASTSITIGATNAINSGSGTLNLTVTQGTQIINFNALSPVTYGSSSFNLTATGGASGNPITYQSSNPLVATISGNTVTIVGAGTTNITASQAGNTDYAAATDVTQTLLVNQASQTITFNTLPPKLTTDGPFALTATGGASGNPITYTSSDTLVATILGNIVTIVGAGTTIITASQAGDANYAAAASVTQNQLVNNAALLTQTITFNALPNATYGDNPITLSATGGGSGNPVTYTSSNTNVATVAGNILTILAPGTTIITASQAGNASYSTATPVSQTQIVDVKNLTLPSATAQNKSYDGTLTATLTGLNLFGVVGSDVVTVIGNASFATSNVGTAISVITNLSLSGADSGKYSLTQPSGLSADITQATQTITFNALAAKTFGGATFTLTASGGNSGNPISYVSDNPLVATVSGNTVTIVGVGTSNITASQAGNSNYAAATDVTQVLTVNKANQTITFPTLPSKVVGDPAFTLGATSTSALAVSYTSSNPLVATILGNVVTIVGIGITNITASQAGNTNYNAATDVVRSLSVTYPIIAAWDFFGVTSPATFAATTFNSNLVSTSGASNITRGATAAASSAGNSFRTVGFKNEGISTTNTDYFQTTLTAAPGYSLSLSSINANFAGTATYAASPGVTSQYAYSLDGTNFTLIGSPFVTIGTPASSPIIDVTSIPALQHIPSSSTLTVRYYASGQTTTGGWGYTSSAAGVNGLAFGGSVTVCSPITNTSSVTVCTSNLPYFWNAQALSNSGTYTYTATSASGCDSIEVLNLTVSTCSSTNLQVKCLIEGYYAGLGNLYPVLANQGQTSTSTACDSIDVELRDENTPTNVVASAKVILNQNATATCTFPSLSGNYYIVIKHRNALQTWSKFPVSFSSSTVMYDFTTAANKAYGDNMIEVEPGYWAFYSGDIVIDDNMDLLDLVLVENDIQSFNSGYLNTDLNGDSNVDLLDSAPMETNIGNFIFSAHP